jgi:hypothetical protein
VTRNRSRAYENALTTATEQFSGGGRHGVGVGRDDTRPTEDRGELLGLLAGSGRGVDGGLDDVGDGVRSGDE